MAARIAIIQGRPDPQGGHFGHALAEAYAQGAAEAGHEVKRIEVAKLEFPILRTKLEWESDAVSPPIRESQEAIAWANHLVIPVSALARCDAGAAQGSFGAGLSPRFRH